VVSPSQPIMTSGSDKQDRPRLGNLLGPTSNSGGKCFVSLDRSGYAREPRPQVEDEDDDENEDESEWARSPNHADPINIPAMKTRTPPRTTWKIAESSGVSM